MDQKYCNTSDPYISFALTIGIIGVVYGYVTIRNQNKEIANLQSRLSIINTKQNNDSEIETDFFKYIKGLDKDRLLNAKYLCKNDDIPIGIFAIITQDYPAIAYLSEHCPKIFDEIVQWKSGWLAQRKFVFDAQKNFLPEDEYQSIINGCNLIEKNDKRIKRYKEEAAAHQLLLQWDKIQHLAQGLLTLEEIKKVHPIIRTQFNQVTVVSLNPEGKK